MTKFGRKQVVVLAVVTAVIVLNVMPLTETKAGTCPNAYKQYDLKIKKFGLPVPYFKLMTGEGSGCPQGAGDIYTERRFFLQGAVVDGALIGLLVMASFVWLEKKPSTR